MAGAVVFLVTHLSSFWTLAPEYKYGWCVIPLALYLFSGLFLALVGVPAREIGAGGAKRAVTNAPCMNDTCYQILSAPVNSALQRNSFTEMLANRIKGARQRFPWDVLVAIVSFAILALAGGTWYLRLVNRDALLEVEVGRLDREWVAVSSNLDDGRRLQVHSTAFLNKTAQVMKERNGDNWTPALQSIGVSAGPDIELRVIHLWKNPDDPSGRLLRIEGASSASDPRLVAIGFSRQLRGELQRHFQMKEECRFERLEDLPELPSANRSPRRAAFTIVVPIGAALPGTGTRHSKD